MEHEKEKSLEYLLELDGERFVIDDELGLWVKFEARQVAKETRDHEIKYSLTLHNKDNHRILGFDNLHEIKYGAKRMVAHKRTYEHWHEDENDKGKPYNFVDAAMLINDFWEAVDIKIAEARRVNK